MAVADGAGPADDPPSLIVVAHHPHGARTARQQFAAQLARAGNALPAPVAADAVAVGAELLGNAVRHARPLPGGVIHLVWRIDRSSGEALVRLRVIDGGSSLVPTLKAAGPDAIDGRGLAIVAALARRWGVDRNGAGCCVWADVGSGDGRARVTTA